MDARRDAGHAQEPVCDHVALHAAGRQARPRHDVPHRDRAGELRFRQRGRHGEETARRRRAAAARDRSLRQFAVHRRAAQRQSVQIVRPSGSRRTPTAPACCPSPSRTAWASSATSTTRSTCRCISSSAAMPTSTSPARTFAICSPAAIPRCRASPRRCRTGQITCRRSSPRCGSRPSSRCAAPMPARSPSSARCRPCSPACSTRPASLDAAWDLVRPWSDAQREGLRADTPRLGLEAKIGRHKLRDVARSVLEISRAGLASRGCRDASGADETRYLDCLDEVVEGHSQAECLIECFRGPWRESVEPAFTDCVY